MENKNEKSINIWLKKFKEIDAKTIVCTKEVPWWIRLVLFFKKERFMVESTNDIVLIFEGKQLGRQTYFISSILCNYKCNFYKQNKQE